MNIPACISFHIKLQDSKVKFLQCNQPPFIWFRLWHFKGGKQMQYYTDAFEKQNVWFVKFAEHDMFLSYESSLLPMDNPNSIIIAAAACMQWYEKNEMTTSKVFYDKFRSRP